MAEATALGTIIYGALVLLYWVAAAAALYLACSRPKTVVARSAYSIIVVALFGYLPATSAYNDWRYDEYKRAALEHFRKRCSENAAERIHRVIENVDAIFIAKPRPKVTSNELRDQYWMGDPYGYSDLEAEHPAGTYLYDRSGKTISNVVFTPIKGYTYVEMANPEHQKQPSMPKYLRYTLSRVQLQDEGKIEHRVVPVATPVDRLKSRYAITWEDISTPEDRKHWVAGGTLTIYDLQTNEVIGERIGYVIDPYLGRDSQGRVIWLHVNHIPGAFCPAFESDFDKNKEFVAKVLRGKGVVHGK